MNASSAFERQQRKFERKKKEKKKRKMVRNKKIKFTSGTPEKYLLGGLIGEKGKRKGKEGEKKGERGEEGAGEGEGIRSFEIGRAT